MLDPAGQASDGVAPLAVDLNCDMGEGMATDAELFPFISSANIACGEHAGDEDTMRRSVELALFHGVAVGAHPSYPDRTDFGRTDLLESTPGKGDRALGFAALPDLLLEQLQRLQSVCAEFGIRLAHVKPHGALYNRAAKDAAVSEIIARVVAGFDPSLLLYGLSGSLMQQRAGFAGLSFISEVFADRTYQPDGSLTPRTQANALIEDPTQAVAQVLGMVKEGSVSTAAGNITIRAESICLHGDGVHAVAFAKLIRDALEREHIDIAAPVRI